jgi:hypothetical protein
VRHWSFRCVSRVASFAPVVRLTASTEEFSYNRRYQVDSYPKWTNECFLAGRFFSILFLGPTGHTPRHREIHVCEVPMRTQTCSALVLHKTLGPYSVQDMCARLEMRIPHIMWDFFESIRIDIQILIERDRIIECRATTWFHRNRHAPCHVVTGHECYR